MRVLLVVLSVAFLCGATTRALAHVPFLEDIDSSACLRNKITTPLEKSIAIYAGLGEHDGVDVFEFKVTQEDLTNQTNKIHTGILTPRCTAHRTFFPSLFLIGPAQAAIPYPSRELRSRIAVAIPKTYGAIEVQDGALDDRDEKSFFEEHTGTWYWWEHKLDLYVEVPGVYLLIVQTNRKEPGDYVLEFGDKEQWTPADWERAKILMPFLQEHREIRSEACRLEVGR
jgi:hypothetical protein